MDEELWLPVVGWEKTYEVSSYGRIRRIVDAWNTYAGRILKPIINNRYPRVTLCTPEGRYPYTVHSLVMAAFVGPPNGKLIHHIDHDPTNNYLYNLEYLTPGEHRVKNRHRLDWDAIIRDYKMGISGRVRLARKYNTSPSAIDWIIVNRLGRE